MSTLLILIISIPLIEIYLFIKIGSVIGAFNTITLIIITALTGIIYARHEGFNTLKSGFSQLVRNEVPIYEIISGAAIAFAAFLLILPGFATDFIGFLLIFPLIRAKCSDPSNKFSNILILNLLFLTIMLDVFFSFINFSYKVFFFLPNFPDTYEETV